MSPVGDQPSMPQDRYAGFWLRLVAHAIDTLISAILFVAICTIALILNLMVGILSKVYTTWPNPGSGFSYHYNLGENIPIFDILFWYSVSLLSQWLYFAFFESSPLMATPGKLALGLIVTDSNGYRVSFWRALTRNIAKVLSHVFIDFGFIMAAFTAKKQALHDILSGCLVLRKH